MKYFTMFDSLTEGAIPPNPFAVLGYPDGEFQNYDWLVSEYPNAHHLAMATQPTTRARGLDVESGDATTDDIPGWLTNFAEPNPVLYGPASTMEAIQAAANHRKDVFYLSAHIGHGEHICSPAVCGYPAANGTQWDFTYLGRNLDISRCEAWLFPPPPDPHHYSRFLKPAIKVRGLRLSELETVKEYDAKRHDPKKNTDRLYVLQAHCALLASRVWSVAHREKPPAWALAHRGWRYQQLRHRADGKQVVK